MLPPPLSSVNPPDQDHIPQPQHRRVRLRPASLLTEEKPCTSCTLTVVLA